MDQPHMALHARPHPPLTLPTPLPGTPPPSGAKGALSFDVYANQRSHVLQQVIRSASGDNRLMNPTAFVDSHPNCRWVRGGGRWRCGGVGGVWTGVCGRLEDALLHLL
jgi:hypothetical protein